MTLSGKQYLDGFAAEGGEILGLAGGDQIPVDHDFGVGVDAAGVNDIVLDGKEAGGVAAFESASGTEDPGAVADGCDEFAFGIDIANEMDGPRMTANVVGCVATGNDHAVEMRRAGGMVRQIARDRVADFAQIC